MYFFISQLLQYGSLQTLSNCKGTGSAMMLVKGTQSQYQQAVWKRVNYIWMSRFLPFKSHFFSRIKTVCHFFLRIFSWPVDKVTFIPLIMWLCMSDFKMCVCSSDYQKKFSAGSCKFSCRCKKLNCCCAENKNH